MPEFISKGGNWVQTVKETPVAPKVEEVKVEVVEEPVSKEDIVKVKRVSRKKKAV